MSWICPKCERELKSENQWHWCERISIDSLFEGKSDELVLAFDRLLSVVADWENVVISATPNCVVFVHRQTFLVVRPMKASLDVKFYSAAAPKEIPVQKTIIYSGRYASNIRVSKSDQLTAIVFRYIRDSYLLL